MIPMDAPPALAERPRFPVEAGDAAAQLDTMFRATPMYATMGITVQDWGPGWSWVTMEPSPAMGNLAGSLHGGATFTLADAAFEIACNAYGRLSVALETTCHYHSPAPHEGTLTAEAWEISRGGRTASYRLRVADRAGTVLTSYLALAYRTSRWHVDPGSLPEGFA